MTKVVEVREAVGLVGDGKTLLIGGSGAGLAVPQRFIDELAAVFTAEGRPRDLTTVRVWVSAISPTAASHSSVCPD